MTTNLDASTWYVIVGTLFIVMALAFSRIKQLPLTASTIYLLVGVGLGRSGALAFDSLAAAPVLEIISEVVVIISIFSVGLKLSAPWGDTRWRLPIRTATVSMAITVFGMALTAVLLLDLSWGAAILLGGILAPTDPVLASDVQVKKPQDQDLLRMTLSGEGGLNDGAAFPFVMLGLGLLGVHEIGTLAWRWLAVDLVWAVCAGLAIGGALGMAIGKVCLYLRRHFRHAVGLDDFLAMGLVAASYGLAVTLHAYGFLAVFAAGAALRRIEALESPAADDEAGVEDALKTPDAAVHPVVAPRFMARAVLTFNEQLERLGEIVVVSLVGAMLGETAWSWPVVFSMVLLFLVIRPLSVWLGLIGAGGDATQRHYMSWFGIRGIGSIYYLYFAVNHGLDVALARQLVAITLFAVALSIFAHGITVTPLMNIYSRLQRRMPRASALDHELQASARLPWRSRRS